MIGAFACIFLVFLSLRLTATLLCACNLLIFISVDVQMETDLMALFTCLCLTLCNQTCQTKWNFIIIFIASN